MFISKAKIGHLTLTEVVAGRYAFFAKDRAYGWKCFATLFFNCEEEQRVRFYNWGLFATFDPCKQDTYGARVKKLKYPLFTDHPNFMELNMKLLAPTEDTLHGGSSGVTLEVEKLFDMQRTPAMKSHLDVVLGLLVLRGPSLQDIAVSATETKTTSTLDKVPDHVRSGEVRRPYGSLIKTARPSRGGNHSHPSLHSSIYRTPALDGAVFFLFSTTAIFPPYCGIIYKTLAIMLLF
ncbi:uncharacterized protein TM35_000102830 [Trypanosoma theileri]|uniref:Uncharacterized protein n=1 Tax=Trypanosoma theileri TaxID=67003 RepID=A0A1X0NZB1_9TRYP|nr:uncharacterized protein TM35_000102830 [Trypanosoma theileri]ORC90015.1 hypothetical protein TM35_000102830 [Trypanosoma theileri]